MTLGLGAVLSSDPPSRQTSRGGVRGRMRTELRDLNGGAQTHNGNPLIGWEGVGGGDGHYSKTTELRKEELIRMHN